MGFTLPLSLFLALGIGIVIVAHALRKGRAEPVLFPAARLIVENAASARKRQRIEDRLLLFMRSLMILSLALLAASPFVKCSRLTLSRNQGASLSAVLVVDDSASMRARVDERSRLDRAVEAGRQLLTDAQPGDSFSVVLAGSPARILVPATTDLQGVREALAGVELTDRGTDLAGALTLARSLQSQVVQSDQPIVILSDLSIAEQTELDLKNVSIPDIGIDHALSNCAIIKANLAQKSVVVEIACTDAEAIAERTVFLENQSGEAVGKATAAQDGMVHLPLDKNFDAEKQGPDIKVRLSSSEIDQIPGDDEAYLLEATSQLSFAVRADVDKAGVKTSSDTVLQSGLEALERAVRVQPLSLLPEDEAALSEFAGLLIDDPSGLSPETRNAIEKWVKGGGVAALFLGPALKRAPLGSNFAPFLTTAPTWTNEAPSGTSAQRAGTLGPLTVTWNDLDARGRALLSPDPQLRNLSTWTDGSPLVAARNLGQGLLVVSALPSSVDWSDFALRPAYLELLDHLVSQANIRLGAAATPVGQRWRVPRGSMVTDQNDRKLEPLSGNIDVRQLETESEDEDHPQHWIIEPDRAGRYSIVAMGQKSYRYATRLPHEHIAQPRTDLSRSGTAQKAQAESNVGISREMALVVLLLSVLELLFRVLWREKSLLSRRNLHEAPSSTKVPAS